MRKDPAARGRHAGKIAPIIATILVAAALGLPATLAPNEAVAAPFTAQKTAQVVGGAAGEGTAQNPIPVFIGNEIEYTIKVNVPDTTPVKPRYDVLFVLDWSASMNAGYNGKEYGSTTSDDDWSARRRAESAIQALSSKLFKTYPQSRIAVMGLNSNDRNKYEQGPTYIQVDTDFVGENQYGTVIHNAFKEKPYLRFDDLPIFMQAGIDKFRNNERMYGGKDSPYGGRVPPKVTVRPRGDQSRIPVMIVISDFQVGMGQFPEKPYTSGDWANVNAQAKSFKSYFPKGVLIGVRADTLDNISGNGGMFATKGHDAKMKETFVGLGLEGGLERWGWIKWQANQKQEEQNDLLLALINEKAPPPAHPAEITDLLPSGLQYVSSEPAGRVSQDGGRDRVTWSYSHPPSGAIEVKVRAKVTEVGTFANSAAASITDVGAVTTNTTYHRAVPTIAKIHLRQMVLERDRSTVELPMIGNMRLTSAGVANNVTTPSGVEGVGTTGFADYNLMLNPGQLVVTVTDIVPQYYELVGHVATTAATTHDPAARKTGEIRLDFAPAPEYWVTVYIRPLADDPDDHTWDWQRNSFGKIFTK